MLYDSAAGLAFAQAIKAIFPEVKSIVDIGCANGVFMQHFINLGYETEGYDISDAAKKMAVIDPDLIYTRDLRGYLIFRRQFDLCVAIEIIEHIEPEYTYAIIDNIKRSAPIAIVTPGNQKERNHFNVQSPEWWIEQFNDSGMTLEDDLTARLRAFLGQSRWGPYHKHFPFIRDKGMVFRRQ